MKQWARGALAKVIDRMKDITRRQFGKTAAAAAAISGTSHSKLRFEWASGLLRIGMLPMSPEEHLALAYEANADENLRLIRAFEAVDREGFR